MSSKAKSWLWMLAVIISETSATSTLKMFDNSEGTTKSLLLGLIVILYVICYYSLSRAVKYIPVGLAYATWSGTGILMVSTLGMLFYGQHPDMAAMIGMGVIASGIVIMNLFSKMGSDEAEPAENSDASLSSTNKVAH
ncbi:multidrug efflux SMR transporter [Providencia sp. PROV188]|jgi:small multidrug resistance pump|uniref:Small multidrug resistance pump n=2 Tax=Providencia TaxID=586 RepID=A0A4R3NK04_9GAMM|nr:MULTISPECIES: multidrug efflux SMR transporter [Providencia]MTC76434.1 QacE family quaternary ammonium compound efflux SMR transporter [Providencia sp. wls1919]ETT02885.1 multidrug resistance protein, SMR family [Providencia alcalifaciens PAL-3]EUC98924.1 multidrug resistance protein, SMR family [Providencia alcalifaciens PAL-1]MBC5791922.1 multidrug efflux SMR transporter [Providencia sp. JUb39]MBG5884568.1 multidrug efflux SMR transporter [Providencia alcalifaciens]